MLKHFLNPPNWFTSASLFCSIYAITLLIGDEIPPDPRVITKACVLVIFGGVFDLLDGRIARMTNRFSEFGVQLDSFADIVSFGVAPAMIAWAWRLHELGTLGAVICFWWVLCAAFRLARFNVNATHNTWVLGGHTQGLTTTVAGASLVTLAWVSSGYLHGLFDPPVLFVAIFLAVLGFLMVSSIPFRNFKDMRKNRVATVTFAVAISLCLGGAFLFDFSMLFGVGVALYLTWGLVDGIAVALHHRWMGHVLDPDEYIDFSELIDEALADYADDPIPDYAEEPPPAQDR